VLTRERINDPFLEDRIISPTVSKGYFLKIESICLFAPRLSMQKALSGCERNNFLTSKRAIYYCLVFWVHGYLIFQRKKITFLTQIGEKTKILIFYFWMSFAIKWPTYNKKVNQTIHLLKESNLKVAFETVSKNAVPFFKTGKVR